MRTKERAFVPFSAIRGMLLPIFIVMERYNSIQTTLGLLLHIPSILGQFLDICISMQI